METHGRCQLTTLLALALALAWLPCFQAQCPGFLIVALDGTGNYRSIQAAVNATCDNSATEVSIFIKPGRYYEKVVIPAAKTKLSLIGLVNEGGGAASVVLTHDDYSGKPLPGCEHDPTNCGVYGTSTTYTLLVRGADFQARDLTIENTAGLIAQAVALHVQADRATCIRCRLIGGQDTLYAHSGRQYYVDTLIEGTTDFVFGAATAIFDRCTLKSFKNSYITAASTEQGQAYGYVFRDCRLTAEPGLATSVYLGRPWRPYARTVFINTQMAAHITPPGWHNWNDPENERTAFYAEYGTQGVDVSQRVRWSHQLTQQQAAQYTNTGAILGGWVPPV